MPLHLRRAHKLIMIGIISYSLTERTQSLSPIYVSVAKKMESVEMKKFYVRLQELIRRESRSFIVRHMSQEMLMTNESQYAKGMLR